MLTSYILEFSDPSATLDTVGGKGLSLAKMIQVGFPVPGGFAVTTQVYRDFIRSNNLQAKILAGLNYVDISLPDTLETASDSISHLFAESIIPGDIASAIATAYDVLNRKSSILAPGARAGVQNRSPVAVRSSATAEDLPEASFAGQQETFLNVCGEDALLEAVKKCWASLWSARAIAYRLKNNVDQAAVALAVLVQEMVYAESAGILFTCNPLNGHRHEMVINAAWGLGEAIVGGLVTPDTIIVDKVTGSIKSMDVAEKMTITVATETGTQAVPLTGAPRTSQVLTAEQVHELVNLAQKIEQFYGTPQDIEWCWSQTPGKFFILQSRPITALPEPEIPAPVEWKLPKGAYAAMRNNIVELMVDPLSPLFATLGISAINASLSRFMNESFGMRGIMPPDIIVVVNHYAYNNGSVNMKGMARLVFGAGKILKMMFTGAVERWTKTGRPRYIEIVESWEAKDWRSFSALELVNGARQLTESAIDAYGALISGVIPAAWITEALFTNIYDRLIKRRGDPSAPTYLLGYDSLPIRADKSLYSLAEWARQDPALMQFIDTMPSRQLVTANEGEPIPGSIHPGTWQEWHARLSKYFHDFGCTIYSLDFIHPIPADDPAAVFDALKLYLRGQGVNPYTRQCESVERREQASQAVHQRLAGLRSRWFTKYLAMAQKYAPLREDGLAEIGLAYPLIRQMLLELGQRFAQQQVVPLAEDIFWLTQEEVLLAASRLDSGQAIEPLKENISRRKAENRAALQVTPPMMLPQMKVFNFDLMSLKKKRGRGGKGDVIKGVAASPGKTTGVARILHGPQDFSQMKPGDILVAPITTPAWTPLFAMASAIVTDVGGPLSHGSIVAREYGVPAVVGTGVATRRIQSGQTITVDGSAGIIILKNKV